LVVEILLHYLLGEQRPLANIQSIEACQFK